MLNTNTLADLPKQMYLLRKLRKLVQRLGECSQLEKLRAAKNKIREWPDSFVGALSGRSSARHSLLVCMRLRTEVNLWSARGGRLEDARELLLEGNPLVPLAPQTHTLTTHRPKKMKPERCALLDAQEQSRVEEPIVKPSITALENVGLESAMRVLEVGVFVCVCMGGLLQHIGVSMALLDMQLFSELVEKKNSKAAKRLAPISYADWPCSAIAVGVDEAAPAASVHEMLAKEWSVVSWSMFLEKVRDQW
eukprot:5430254-Amphidinium_carterae.2